MGVFSPNLPPRGAESPLYTRDFGLWGSGPLGKDLCSPRNPTTNFQSFYPLLRGRLDACPSLPPLVGQKDH